METFSLFFPNLKHIKVQGINDLRIAAKFKTNLIQLSEGFVFSLTQNPEGTNHEAIWIQAKGHGQIIEQHHENVSKFSHHHVSVNFGMEREGNARTESQNCLKTSWTQPIIDIYIYIHRIISIYWDIYIYAQRETEISKLLLQTLDWKAGVRRWAWQWAGPVARDTESKAGLEISSYLLRLHEFFLSSGSPHLSSAWSLCKMKMRRWILEATSLEWPFSQCQTSLPFPSLVTLSKNTALMCQTEPGSWESALLLHHIWEVSEQEPQEPKADFLPPTLLGICSQENDSFCLKSFYPYAPCPRLTCSPTDYKVIHGAAPRLILTQLTFSLLRL